MSNYAPSNHQLHANGNGRNSDGFPSLAGKKSTIADTQMAIRHAAAALHQFAERLAEISTGLEQTNHHSGFEARAELRGVLECVQADLLSDAIETLNVAATASEKELQNRYEERQQWLYEASWP